MGKADQRGGRLDELRSFIAELYGPDLHSKRIDALAGATLGVMAAASLVVAVIGQALAQARGLVTKHAVKQMDRLLSNTGIDVWDSSVSVSEHLKCVESPVIHVALGDSRGTADVDASEPGSV